MNGAIENPAKKPIPHSMSILGTIGKGGFHYYFSAIPFYKSLQ